MLDNKKNKSALAERFHVAFMRWYNNSGKKQAAVAPLLGMTQGAFSRFINKKIDVTLATMEIFASSIDVDLIAFILAGEPPTPPVAVQAPPAPGPSRDDELEALKQKLEAARDRNDRLTDELLGKDKIISTTVEALRIKDIEIAEKRELLTAKDKIIQQLVDLLKEAGLEHTIPPALASQMEKNQER